MTAHDLAEAIRGLHFLDRDDVPFLSGEQWRNLQSHPTNAFIRFDTATRDRVFDAMQAQQQVRAARLAKGA